LAEVKWIKLSTSMFDDEKIRLIEQMPDADTILIIWIKLLAQAGKTNASGYIYLNENIPYTDEMLATILNRPISTIRLALKTFEQFGMIKIDEDDFISISNWEKHQNIEGMERIRLQNRERKRRQREKGNKQLKNKSVTSRDSHATDIDIDIDKEYIVEIVNYLNRVSGKKYKPTTNKTKKCINARINEGFSVDDFKQVIDKKVNAWQGTDMEKYIRPETLFGTKFEGYLNEKNKQFKKGISLEEFDLDD